MPAALALVADISIAVSNIMVGGFWNDLAHLETDFKYDIGTCVEICRIAVKYYLENARSE